MRTKNRLKPSDITDEVKGRLSEYSRVLENGCWIWFGFARTLSTGRRYPLMTVKGRTRPAQIVARMILHPRPIMRVGQSCGNDLCVAPMHQIKVR